MLYELPIQFPEMDSHKGKAADSATASEICAFLKWEMKRSFGSFINLNNIYDPFCVKRLYCT